MFKPSDFSDVALIAYLILSSKQPNRPQIDRLREAATIAEDLTANDEPTWPPKDLAASLARWEDFRAIDIGEKHEIWEVHGLRNGEWFNLFDLDTGQAIAEFVRDALKAEKLRLNNAK